MKNAAPKVTGQKSAAQALAGDLLWGAVEIGQAIGRSRRQTFHMLERGLLPARKVGGSWAASRRRLLEHLTGAANGP
jgi:hypothetical protein